MLEGRGLYPIIFGQTTSHVKLLSINPLIYHPLEQKYPTSQGGGVFLVSCLDVSANFFDNAVTKDNFNLHFTN